MGKIVYLTFIKALFKLLLITIKAHNIKMLTFFFGDT